MTVPTMRVELATDGGPFTAAPTWTTLPSTDVLAFSMQEGRQSPTDTATQPSTATLRFDNSARKYDPLYSSGTYYGDLVPGRQVRVTVIEGDATETVVFRGVVGPEGWQQRDYRHPATSTAVVNCLDWLGVLGSWPSDLPPFEAYLRQLAIDHSLWGLNAPSIGHGTETPGVLHWRLDDSSGWSGEQTFHDPLDNADLYSPYGVTGYKLRVVGTAVPASAVHSDVAVRPELSGSIDTLLGFAECNFNGTAGFGSSTDNNYSATFGFGLRLRGFPTVDLAPLVVDNAANGNGFFIDRDGGLVVIMDEGTTQVSTDVSSAYRLSLDTDYLVTVTYDETTNDVLLYVNGVEKASNTAYPSLGAGASTTSLYVGGGSGTDTTPAANVCDLFAIGTPFTAAEVATLYELWQGFDGVFTGDAASAMLTALGVPHSASAGRVALGEQTGTVAPSALLQSIERSELGRLYVDHRNEQVTLVTLDDLATTARHMSAQFVLSDQSADTGAGYMRYHNPVVVNLPAVNSASASNGLVTWSLRDEASVGAYGVQATSNAMASGTETDPLAVAQYLLVLDPDPTTAVRSVTVTPTSAIEFGEVLDSNLFDLCTLKRQPHNLGSVLSTSMLVEGRSLDIGDGAAGWSAVYFLRTYDAFSWWLWGTGEFETGTTVYDADRNGARLGP